jgi:putative salt-induced outer membrane protein YdiY
VTLGCGFLRESQPAIFGLAALCKCGNSWADNPLQLLLKPMKLSPVLTVFLLGVSVASALAEASVSNAPPKNPWDASATLGVTLTRGNSKTLLISGQVQASKKWDRNEVDLGADGVYGENNSVKNAEAIHGYGQYNRLFSERLFAYFRLEGLHDAIADVDYRLSLSPGAGYYVIKQTNLFLRAEIGPGYVFEKLAGKTHDYATLRLAERGEWKINPRAKIWESVEILPQVDKFENYVINAEIGIDTAITAKLSQVTFLQDTYRSEPAPGRVHNDVKLVAGLKYRF